jgi:hypothetical protein
MFDLRGVKKEFGYALVSLHAVNRRTIDSAADLFESYGLPKTSLKQVSQFVFDHLVSGAIAHDRCLEASVRCCQVMYRF